MHAQFLHGLELFNSHDFFDCHDVWEDLWMDTVGPDKLFFQGMIQVAVAYYHAGNGNFSGARSLMDKALPKLTAYLPIHLRIDLSALLPILATHRNQFRNAEGNTHPPFDINNAPTIPLMEERVP